MNAEFSETNSIFDPQIPRGRVTFPLLRRQQPGSLLVKALAQESDVFAFSYGQTVPVDVIPKLPNLRDGIHPTAKGIDAIVARILPSVEQLIARVRARTG